MGKLVVAFIDAEFGVAFVARFIGEDKGADAGHIGLESEHQHVAEQAQMLGIVVRHPRGRGDAGRGGDEVHLPLG